MSVTMSSNNKRQHDREEAGDNCEVASNSQVQIKLKMATSNDDRRDGRNIMYENIEDIQSYICEGYKFACEELHSTNYDQHAYDQHVRFFMDLDKVKNPKLHVVKDFVKHFVGVLYAVIDDIPDEEIQISNQYTEDVIISGARIAMKTAEVGGVHIYFTNVITHASSFPHFHGVMREVKKRGQLWYHSEKERSPSSKLLSSLKLFEHIDLAMYKSVLGLRCIYAVKDSEYGCHLFHCKQPYSTPCKHIADKIYIPQEGYDFTDYFFSYLGEECFDAMHIELLEPKHVEHTSQPETYVSEQDPRNDKLSVCSKLIDLIDNVDYQKYILVGLAMFNRLDGSREGKSLYKDWAISKFKDKSQQIDNNWDKYWPSRKSERKVGLGTLKKLAEDSNPEAYSQWLAEYSWTGIKKLLCTFTHTDVSKYFYAVRSNDYIYSGKSWYMYNAITKLWEKSDSADRLLNDLADYFQTELQKFYTSQTARRRNAVNQYGENSTNVQKIDKLLDSASAAYDKICTCQFKKDLISELRGRYTKNDIKFNEQRDVLNFKDCVLELRTGSTRERCQLDYCTKCLPFNYELPSPGNKVYCDKVRKIFESFSNDRDLTEELLCWLGYCMTGETSGYNLLFVIGLLAANGKTTIARIMSLCLPIYIASTLLVKHSTRSINTFTSRLPILMRQ